MDSHDSDNTSPEKPRSHPKLPCIETPEAVKRHLALVYSRVKAGRLTPQQGNTLIFALNSMSKLMRDVDLSNRLAAVEERVAQVLAAAAEARRGARPMTGVNRG